MTNTEDSFTPSRPDCPNPEYWHADDDDSTEHEVTALVAAFVKALQPEYVIETGSAFGQTSVAIGKTLKSNGHGKLITLETEIDRVEITKKKCRGLPVTVKHESSLSFTPDHSIDFAWFDSLTHLRAKECERFAPYMSPRAVVGFHDTGPQHPTRRYMEQLVRNGVLVQPLFLPTPRGVCFARIGGGLLA